MRAHKWVLGHHAELLHSQIGVDMQDVAPGVTAPSEAEPPEPAGSGLRCAIYARTLYLRSGIEKVESQIEICRAAARREGLQVSERHIFTDNITSRVKFHERSGLKGLLDAARSKAHPFEVVLIDKNSRFSRKFYQILGIYSNLSKAGVKVRVVSDASS